MKTKHHLGFVVAMSASQTTLFFFLLVLAITLLYVGSIHLYFIPVPTRIASYITFVFPSSAYHLLAGFSVLCKICVLFPLGMYEAVVT